MHDLKHLKDMLCEALGEYGKRDVLTQSSLQTIDILAHACKNVCKVIEACETKDNGDIYGVPLNKYQNVETSMVAGRLRDIMSDTHDEAVRSEIQHLVNKVESL